MKRLARIPAAVAAVFLAALAADAQDVSTTTPPPAKPTIQYVEGRGVVFRTPDDLFEASLGFNLQVRFTDLDLDPTSTLADADEFRVRRFKLFLSGFALDPRLTWRLQVDFAAPSARVFDDGWLNWKFSDAVSLQGGQYKTPFSREELYNDGVIQFPERALATDAFKPSRDVGVMLAGSFLKDRLAYQAGVFGGDGQNSLRVSDHVMPMVRLLWNPIGTMGQGEADVQNHQEPALSLGVAGFHNTLPKATDVAFEGLVLNYAGPAGWLGRSVKLFTTDEDVSIQSGGLEGQFKWHGLSVQGEYFVGQAEGKTSRVRLYSYGYYGQAGFFILPCRWDVAARYSLVDYDRNVAGNNVSVVSAVTTYYFRRHSLKILLDYSRTHRQRASPLEPANDQAFTIQAQLMP
jgi:phosphate-selective porin OprO and OprP